MRSIRTATVGTLAVAPLLLLLLPLSLVRPPEPPPIPDGAVQPTAPVGAVAIPDTAFEALHGVDAGGFIDPHTGQPKLLTYFAVDGQRITVRRIRSFLDKYRSPMAPYSRDIVAAGVRYGADPRLIVAISGTESTFGKFHVGYNAWGWDAPNGLTRWPDWPTAIDAYTRSFATGYRSRDPATIGPRYCPDCDRWPYTTRLFFSMI